VTGEYEEKHAKAVETDFGFFDDKKTHLFKLGKYCEIFRCSFKEFCVVVRSGNTYSIVIDDVLVSSGSLLEDFTCVFNIKYFAMVILITGHL